MSDKGKRTAVFGLGYFGLFHLKNVASLGFLKYGVDLDAEKKKSVEGLGGKFSRLDLVKAIEIKRDKNENPISHKIKKNTPEILELAKNTDVWDIVTNPPSHFPLMVLGIESGKDIFIEKPACEKVSEIEYILKKFPKAKIGVDYIEMAHPAVLAIRDRILKEKFQPFYFLNHRSKDLRENARGLGGGMGSRIVLDDLVHDLSEIGFFQRVVGVDSLVENLSRIENVRIQSWKEAGYPYAADAKAGFSLLFNDGAKAEIEGSFVDPEVRQFLITDKNKKAAFYGNTLTRDKIKPMAAKIIGRENVEELERKIKEMRIIDDKTQDEILKKVKSEILKKEMEKYESNQLLAMLKNFYGAESKKDLVCPLEQAMEYQKIVERVYGIAGKSSYSHGSDPC